MKNTETNPSFSQLEDEISLIDLTKILVKRRKTVFLVALIPLLLALVFAFVKDKNYPFVTIYKTAEKDTNVALESVEALIEQVNNRYWPEVSRHYQAEHDLQSMPFKLDVSNPKGTLLLVLTTDAEPSERKEVDRLHNQTLQGLIAHQKNVLKSMTQRLQRQIDATHKLIDQLKDSKSEKSTDLLSTYNQRLFSLEDQLSSYREGEMLQHAVEGGEATSMGKALVIAIGLVLGIICGIVAAFLAEFSMMVRQSLREEQDV